jgi:hypothetical protein
MDRLGVPRNSICSRWITSPAQETLVKPIIPFFIFLFFQRARGGNEKDGLNSDNNASDSTCSCAKPLWFFMEVCSGRVAHAFSGWLTDIEDVSIKLK